MGLLYKKRKIRLYSDLQPGPAELLAEHGVTGARTEGVAAVALVYGLPVQFALQEHVLYLQQ